jgi:hypothetical protein
MNAVTNSLQNHDSTRIDQHIRLHNVSWRDYEALLAMRGDNDGYVALPRSKKLPELDTDLLAQCMTHSRQTQAVKALRRALRERRRADNEN